MLLWILGSFIFCTKRFIFSSYVSRSELARSDGNSKQPKFSLTDKLIKKMWCVCVCVCVHVCVCMCVCVSVCVYNGILLSRKKEAAWMYLEMIILSEVSQTEKDKLSYDITYLWNPKKWYKWIYLQSRNRFTDIENKCMVTEGETELGEG